MFIDKKKFFYSRCIIITDLFFLNFHVNNADEGTGRLITFNKIENLAKMNKKGKNKKECEVALTWRVDKTKT